MYKEDITDIEVLGYYSVQLHENNYKIDIQNTIPMSLNSTEKTKLLDFNTKLHNSSTKINKINEELVNVSKRKSGINKDLKQLSAGITRTALNSNKTGQAVLSMLSKIRNNAKKQVTKQ